MIALTFEQLLLSFLDLVLCKYGAVSVRAYFLDRSFKYHRDRSSISSEMDVSVRPKVPLSRRINIPCSSFPQLRPLE